MERAKPTGVRATFFHLQRHLRPVLITCTLLGACAYCWAGQANRNTGRSHQLDPLQTLKRDTQYVEDGNIMVGRDLERIADAHETQAIQFLEQMFLEHRTQTLGIDTILSKIPPATSQDDSAYETSQMNLQNELHIANVLIRLGVHDDVYWTYLANQAQASLEINMPFNTAVDALGEHNPPTNPAFLAWGKSHNADKNEAAMFQFFVQPTPIMFLATTADPRGAPLLRQALASTNPLIQASAAKGLALLHDNSSIPLIIAACNRIPVSARAPLAESLLYFDDPQAQQYAQLNLPKDTYLSVRQRIAQGHTPFH